MPLERALKDENIKLKFSQKPKKIDVFLINVLFILTEYSNSLKPQICNSQSPKMFDENPNTKMQCF